MTKKYLLLFLSHLSVRKNGRYFAGAKSVLTCSKNFYEYIKAWHFCFAQSFSLQTGASELNIFI